MLMGSSAQNSSGVHWCRRRVRFNEVPEKVPGLGGFGAEQGQVQQGSGEGSGEGLGGFGAEPSQVQQGSGEGIRRREALVQSRVRFGEGSQRRCGGAEPGQVQKGRVREKVPEKPGRLWCRASSGEGSGGFGAEPGQVQQGSGEGSGEGSSKPWCKGKSGSGIFGAGPGQVQRVPEKVPEKVAEKKM